MNIKCKCGRITNYGVSCTFCRQSFELDPDLQDLEIIEEEEELPPIDEQLKEEYGDILGLDDTEQED